MGLSQHPTVVKPSFWAADTLSATSQSQMSQAVAHAMPRPPSMLFDLEMEEAPSTPQLDAQAQQAVSSVQRLVRRSIAPCSEVARDVEAACQSFITQGRNVSTQALAEALSNLGYSVAMREGIGGGSGGQCLRNLRHSFLYCLPGQKSQVQQPYSITSSSGGAIFVDPTFRDQFDIAHKTPRYAAVLEALPAVFVCHSSRIQALVELLCAEMSLAFHSTGNVLPPWRYTKSMLSKWQPRQSIDLSVMPARAPAATSKEQLQPAGASQTLPPMAAPAVVRSSLLFRNVRAVSEASGSNSSGAISYPAAGQSRSGSSRESCSTAISNSSATPGQYPMDCPSGSSGNQDLLAAQQEHQHHSHQDDQAAVGQAGDDSFSSLRRMMSDAAALPTSTALEMLPARRQLSYEPLRRVVGGFAASLGSGAHNFLLTLAQ